MLCFICDTQRIKSIWMSSSVLTNPSYFYMLLHPWYWILVCTSYLQPQNRPSAFNRSDGSKVSMSSTMKCYASIEKTFSPPIVENTLPTVNRSATNRGAVKWPKPLKGDQPPFCYNLCCSEGTWLIIPGVDVKAEYRHDVMCCRPDHLEGIMRIKKWFTYYNRF